MIADKRRLFEIVDDRGNLVAAMDLPRIAEDGRGACCDHGVELLARELLARECERECASCAALEEGRVWL